MWLELEPFEHYHAHHIRITDPVRFTVSDVVVR